MLGQLGRTVKTLNTHTEKHVKIKRYGVSLCNLDPRQVGEGVICLC